MGGDGEAAPSHLEIISKMHFPIFLILTQIQHLSIPGLTEMQLYPLISHRDERGDGYNIFRGNNDSAFPPSQPCNNFNEKITKKNSRPFKSVIKPEDLVSACSVSFNYLGS